LNRYTGNKNNNRSKLVTAVSRSKALQITETSYLSATTALIWIALYYLPIGGAFFRLALPLPLAFLHLRRGKSSAFEGLITLVLLLSILMGPVRGPLVIFPYGLLSLWLGWSWYKGFNWWISWSIGVLIGTIGFFVRVMVLSLLVGENLWIIITRAGYGLLDKFITFFDLQFFPELGHVQLISLFLIVFQEIIYVLTLHALAYWIFPRLKAKMPEPPALLHNLVVLDSL
tara:strand:- start:1085 stop:1771 length:687 start_codon:yes stop_codon:yes gene_type:complete